jgi:hypothetical protein
MENMEGFLQPVTRITGLYLAGEFELYIMGKCVGL